MQSIPINFTRTQNFVVVVCVWLWSLSFEEILEMLSTYKSMLFTLCIWVTYEARFLFWLIPCRRSFTGVVVMVVLHLLFIWMLFELRMPISSHYDIDIQSEIYCKIINKIKQYLQFKVTLRQREEQKQNQHKGSILWRIFHFSHTHTRPTYVCGISYWSDCINHRLLLHFNCCFICGIFRLHFGHF